MPEDGKLLDSILSSFCCEKDPEIEDFLKNKAVEFEKLNKSRTYIVFDEERLLNGEPIILGYFSLSLKVLILPEDMSITSRKNIDGYRGKINGNPIREIPCYLIGQLAKNSSIDNSFQGQILVDNALAVINSAVNSVGGRYVLIECQPIEKLLSFYGNNFFTEFANISLKDKPMIQMIRKIC